MSYTKIAKPGAQSYTAVNAAKPSFDEPSISYDDIFFYDGANPNQYTNLPKPLSPDVEYITNGNFDGNADGWFLNNFTYSGNHITASGSSNELITDDGFENIGTQFLFNPDFTGSATGWDLTTFVYGNNKVSTTNGGRVQTNSAHLFNMVGGQNYNLQSQINTNAGSHNLFITIGDGTTVLFSESLNISGSFGFGINFLCPQSLSNCYIVFSLDAGFSGSIPRIEMKEYLGSDQTFNLLANMPYNLSLTVGGTTGTLRALIYGTGNNGANVVDQVIAAGAGIVNIPFTPLVNMTSCYFDIFSNNGFNGTLDSISIKGTSSIYTKINKPI